MKFLIFVFTVIIFHPFVWADTTPKDSLNKQDEDGRTELHYAVIVGELSHYVKKKVILVNKQDSVYLHNVDTKGHLEKVRSYLEQGANPEIQDIWGETPLFYIARTGNLPMFHLLLGRSANPDIQNKEGNTTLHTASYHGHLEIVRFLIDKESVNRYTSDSVYTSVFADLNPKEVELFKKIVSSTTPVVRLDKKEANLYIKNYLGTMPIHRATEGGHLEIVHLFIKKGVNPDIQDDLGRTILYVAVLRGHLGLVRYLIDVVKVNPNIQDISGRTPLDLAELIGEREIAEFLLTSKCRISFKRF